MLLIAKMANFVDKAGDDAEAESIKSGTSNKSANVCSALGGAFTNCFEFLSGNSVPPVPKVIIPDPGFEGSFTFTLKKRNFISSDYEAYQGQEAVEEARWLFVNKSGSIFKREARIDIENYIRGGNPEKPKQGQLLFSAGFDDKPRFTQALRQGGPLPICLRQCLRQCLANCLNGPDRRVALRFHTSSRSCTGMQFASGLPMGFVSDGRMWDNDSHYLSHSSLGLGRSYAATLFLNWTMQTSAVLSTETRGAHPSLQAWGQPIRLNVYACGTAIARYYQDEEPVYKTDDSGESRRVGVRRIWRRNVNEFVDAIQV